MQPPPPPSPETSRKRILPAFLLCFTVCAHRIYAGRYISGVIQIAAIAGAFLWEYLAAKDLIAALFFGHHGDDLMVIMNEIDRWQDSHGSMPLAPALMIIAVGIWVAIDAGKLLAGKFKDGKGLPITRWL